MITHETPGDTFWDKIKAGAPAGGQELRHRPEVLQRPCCRQPGDADPERRRLEGRRHRDHAGDAGRTRRRLSRTRTTRRSQWWRSTRGSTSTRMSAPRCTSAPTRHLAGETAGAADRRGGWQAHALRDPGRRLGGARGALRRREEQGSEHREHPGGGKGRLCGRLLAPGQAVPGQVDRLHRHARRPDRPGRAEGQGRLPAARRRSSPSTSAPMRRRPSRTATSSSRSTSSPTSRGTRP